MISSGFRIGITCCFCGGSLDIDEASHAVRCKHCASILKIVRHGRFPQYFIRDKLDKRQVKFHIDSHFRRHELPMPSSWQEIRQFYVPFWWIKGTVFSVQKQTAGMVFETSGPESEWYDQQEQVTVKIIERSVSLCADTEYPWGLQSLGVRPQVVSLTAVDSDFLSQREIVTGSVDHPTAIQRFEASVASTARAVAGARSETDTTAVGTSAMLIFFPIWLAEIVSLGGKSLVHFDPVAERVVTVVAADSGLPNNSSELTRPDYRLDVVPHRCPNCGADFPDSEVSETFYCQNCRRLFLDRQDRYEPLRLWVPRAYDRAHTLFPLWEFDLNSVTGPSVEALRKLIQVTGFRADHFVMPAFRVSNPERLIRLIVHYNRGKHDISLDDYPDGQYELVDVDLNPQEASELLMPLTVACAASRGFKIAGLTTEKLEFQSQPRLLWLPYVRDRYFWREQITGASIEKAAVRM